MVAAVQSGATFQAAAPKPLFDTRLPNGVTRFDIGKDGRFLIPTQTESGGVPAMIVVLNWTAGLKSH
jgi:hypothetical protein